jgi:transglutaminase-like putative cysteine protease
VINTIAILHDLLERIHEDIALDSESASAARAAAEAFKEKRGGYQDLTHIFIAVARALGVPARYVGGYFSGSDDVSVQDAGHAWAEAHVPDLGWIGFDPANGVCVTDQHVRVAIGLDHLGAAPVRGAHYGGGREEVAVRLEVTQASWQAQE